MTSTDLDNPSEVIFSTTICDATRASHYVSGPGNSLQKGGHT